MRNLVCIAHNVDVYLWCQVYVIPVGKRQKIYQNECETERAGRDEVGVGDCQTPRTASVATGGCFPRA